MGISNNYTQKDYGFAIFSIIENSYGVNLKEMTTEEKVKVFYEYKNMVDGIKEIKVNTNKKVVVVTQYNGVADIHKCNTEDEALENFYTLTYLKELYERYAQ